MHLLEKEPDNRYQTADGLVHDLERLRDADAPAAAALRVGEHDVPLRLLPPSRLVGRDDEVAALEAAFEDALAGRCRGVLVGGAPGVGKTALVDRAAAGGDRQRRLVRGRQVRPVPAGPGVRRGRIRRFARWAGCCWPSRRTSWPRSASGSWRRSGRTRVWLTAVVPEFAALLGVPPDPGDPLTAQVRAQRSAVEVLRAVASRKRPVVVFVDDLQWAGRTPLGFVDLVLSEEPIEGLLLVGAYRDGDVDAAHPLAAPLSRWRDQAGVRHLRLDNLPGAEPGRHGRRDAARRTRPRRRAWPR